MTVVFTEDQWGSCGFPGIAQSFVNHDALLYKVYYMGNQPFVIHRPSIGNLSHQETPENAPLHFYSKDVSKPPSWETGMIKDRDEGKKKIKLSVSTLVEIGRAIQSSLGLELFGIDLAFEKETNRWALLDLNIFPSYAGVKHHGELIADFVLNLLQENCVKKTAHMTDSTFVPYCHQVGGHEATAPLLCNSSGHVLKPLQSGGRGERELDFYENVWNSKNTHTKEARRLQQLIPKFFGSTQIETQSYIILQNIVHNFGKPCVMDLKIGKQTCDPSATAEKRETQGLKYAGTRTSLGLSLTGIQYFDKDTMVKKGKDFGKALNPQTLGEAVANFFGHNKFLVQAGIRELEKIEEFFKSQNTFAFYGSSVLVAYDAAQVEKVENIKEWFCVKMIDFTHVFHQGTKDHNYAEGLENLVNIFNLVVTHCNK